MAVPVFNKPGILVLRPRQQASALIEQLQQAGFRPLAFPTIEISTYQQANAASIFEQLSDFDKIIFISRNAVEHFFYQLQTPPGHFPETLAIGKATLEALRHQGIDNALENHSQANSESLLSMPVLQTIENQKILIVRGHGGREYLKEQLQNRGAMVDYLEVYQRRLPNSTTEDFAPLWQQGIAAVIATSNQIIDNLLQIIGKQYADAIKALPLVVISERMNQYADALGFKTIGRSASPANDEILITLEELLKQTNLN